jgi:hypothetical protein
MRYLMMMVLLPAAVIAQLTVNSTLARSAEETRHDCSGAVLAAPTRADEAQEACNSRTLPDRGQLEMRPSGYRIAATAGEPARTPDPASHPAPDPAPGLTGVPLSFNDPVYAKVTSRTSSFALSSGASATDLSIVESSGDPTITCKGSCSLTRVRIQSREGIRCIGGDINLTWVYITATGLEGDHADGVQCYAPGSTGTVTVKNSTFKMAGVTTAGYFSADDWRGSHVFENVLFEGGSFGLRIPADGGSSVSLKDVYFVRGSFRYRAFLFDVVKGRRINIVQWENVRWASWQGDQLVLGNLIPKP